MPNPYHPPPEPEPIDWPEPEQTSSAPAIRQFLLGLFLGLAVLTIVMLVGA